MGEAKLYGQNKGGMSINGIIKDYYAYAGENISAGDLVEYIKGVAGKKDYGESVDTQLSAETKSGYTISAVQLDENRVFVAHSYGSDYHLYGIVCKIDGANITYGTDTQLNSTQYSGHKISSVLLNDGKVFIAHRRGSTYLNGIVCTINGTTIVTGTDTAISSNSYSGNTFSVELLPDNKVFIAHSYSAGYLYGIVCTINATAITTGTDTAINSSTSGSGAYISTCPLSDKVFIAHSYGSLNHLYGIVCSISGTTISKGSDTVISNSSDNTGVRMSTTKLDDNRVFISYAHTDSSSYLNGIVCAISDMTFTKGAETLIDQAVYSAYSMSTVKVADNKVFIAHSKSNDFHLYGVICTISDKVITPCVDTKLNDSTYVSYIIKSLLLNNGTILIAHGYSTDYLLNAQIFGIDEENNIPTNVVEAKEYETQVRKTTTTQFDGVAKTSGTGGDDIGHNDLVSIWTKG